MGKAKDNSKALAPLNLKTLSKGKAGATIKGTMLERKASPWQAESGTLADQLVEHWGTEARDQLKEAWRDACKKEKLLTGAVLIAWHVLLNAITTALAKREVQVSYNGGEKWSRPLGVFPTEDLSPSVGPLVIGGVEVKNQAKFVQVFNAAAPEKERITTYSDKGTESDVHRAYMLACNLGWLVQVKKGFGKFGYRLAGIKSDAVGKSTTTERKGKALVQVSSVNVADLLATM